MKRDMELVKKILEYVAENADPIKGIKVVQIDGYNDEKREKIVYAHVVMLRNAGFIGGKPEGGPVSVGTTKSTFSHNITHVTWQGYDLLDELLSKSTG